MLLLNTEFASSQVFNIENMIIYSTDRIKPRSRFQQSSVADYFSSTLSVFPVTVEASIQEADPLLQVVSLLSHHPVSHHLLFPN